MKKTIIIISIIAIISLLISFGCLIKRNGKNEKEETAERPTVSLTLRTEKLELFMEYPSLIENEEAAFITHLTDHSDFKPITEGELIMNFSDEKGTRFSVVAEAPIRDGIFRPVAQFNQSGAFHLEMILNSAKVSDTIYIENIKVYSKEDDLSFSEEETGDLGQITFLKEQQWKTDFQVEPVQKHHLKKIVEAVGEIEPKLQYHVQVVSPVEGIIQAGQDSPVLVPGNHVKKGQILAIISPPFSGEGSWTALKLAYEKAQIDYERAERLIKKMAISEKEYQEAKRNYQLRKSSYESLMGNNANPSDRDEDSVSQFFSLTAPISGIISEMSFVPGQKISAGQKMLTIINPSKVWLTVKVPEKDVHFIGGVSGASFQPISSESLYVLDSSNSKLLSLSDIVDPKSRTVKLIFEVDNPNRDLKVGQFVSVSLHTEDDIQDIAVPESAVFEEGREYVVYVQKRGETFEKRKVKTGVQFQKMVQIIEGLEQGEWLVTIGGYQLKLASLSEEVGHGHTH
jgi:RND family efflux transporter MFP subunit